jgi:predicted CXXCH cytochrome family protein
MGKSIGPPEALAAGSVTHRQSGSVLSVQYRGGRMFHVVAERGLTAEYAVAYQIGSGIKGRTFAVEVGSYLLESPLSWYAGSGWDVSPGFESMQLLDFDRPITSNCLFCHAGTAKFADADGRRLDSGEENHVEAITCQRCHGDGQAHARRPSSINIVNPVKLTGAARDSVCEQCHLEGETRILNPGKTLDDYRPGQPLEETVVTYLFRQGSSPKRAVSQVEELAESACARGSAGRLWCGSCHDPHGPTQRSAGQRASEFARVCKSCHPDLSKAAHPAGQRECAGCHMPARPANNIAHLAVTDHRIRRPGAAAGPAVPDGVVAWREGPTAFRRRDLALAELQIASKENLPAMLRESVRQLEALPESQQNNDADVLSSLEVAFLESSPPARAVALSRWAVESAPNSATFALNYALALKRAGDLKQAEHEFLRSIDLDKSLMQSYAELAVLYDGEGRRAESMAVIERYLKWNPQSIQFRLTRRQ